MNVLCEANLADLPSAIIRPRYDRARIGRGILHIGTGNFHRAHQAVYTDDILAEDPRWGIIGASLLSGRLKSLLAPQDYLYSLSERAENQESVRIIGAIKNILVLSSDRQALTRQIASPETSIITLTITEKGYCLNDQGRLDSQHEAIQHDIEHPATPISAPGVLLNGLKVRMKAGAGPLTILSCDNLSANGVSTQSMLTELAEQLDRDLASWCRDHIQFPNSMVDRIVPSTTDKDQYRIAAAGVEDKAPVISERYRQWVIEDSFAAARPPWETAGAQLVRNVEVFETAKLRLLNATHSALACLGLLCGHEYIHEAMADETLGKFARYLMEAEIAPVLENPPDFDLPAYIDSILTRFANSSIAYRCAQVACDSSKKLPVRIYPSIETALSRHHVPEGLGLVTAAWLLCLSDQRIAADISDPVLTSDAAFHADLPLGNRPDLFGPLAGSPGFMTLISNAMAQLKANDPRQSLARLTG